MFHDKGTCLTSGRARQGDNGCWNVQTGQCSDSISSQMVSSRPWNRVQVHAGTVCARRSLWSLRSSRWPHLCVRVHALPGRSGEPWSKSTGATGLPTCPAATLPPTQPPGCPQTQQGLLNRKVPQRRKVWDVQIPIKTPGTQSCKDTAFLGKSVYARSGRFLELEEISGTWSQMDHLGGALKCRFAGSVR